MNTASSERSECSFNTPEGAQIGFFWGFCTDLLILTQDIDVDLNPRACYASTTQFSC